jgi:DNA-binding CsgD family transcriptional regulator/tetratricopeptide (TPR) repeat protein
MSPTTRTARDRSDGGVLLAGRDREIDELQALLERAIRGTGSIVLISGEAGIGKTALVRTVARAAEQRGALVLAGGCYDLGVTPPYGPWVELLQRYHPSGNLPPLPSFVSDSASLADLQSQEALFAGTLAFLRELACHRPLVLVLEDLHWADQASLDLLRFVARSLNEHRILLVAIYRDDEVTRRHPLSRLLPLLVREANASRIDLHPLGDQSIADYVDSRYQLDSGAHVELVRYLLDRSDGNPLFIEEILRTLELDGVVQPERDGWRVGDLTNTTVPGLIQQVVEARLGRLSEAARSALESAAVIGQEVDWELWQDVLAGAADRLDGAVEEALEARLIEELPGGRGVAFRHALVREAIHDTLTLPRRRREHRQVAEVLLRRPAPDPDDAAFHLRQAGDPRAADWLILAGERAERRYAWTEAIERHEQAVSLLQQSAGRQPEAAGLMLKIGRLFRMFDPQRGLSYLREARTTALEHGDLTIANMALFASGLLECHVGDMRRGLAAMHEAAGALESRAEDVDRVARWALTVLPSATFERPLVVISGALALWLAGAGRYAEAIATVERHLEPDWREAVDPQRFADLARRTLDIADGYGALTIASAQLGRPDEARLAALLAREQCRITGHAPLVHHMAYLSLVCLHLPYRASHLDDRDQLASDVALSGFVTGFESGPGAWARQLLLFYGGHWRDLRQLLGDGRFLSTAAFRDFNADVPLRLAYAQGDAEQAWAIIRSLFPDGPTTEPGGNIHLIAIQMQRIAVELALTAGDLDVARGWLNAHGRWLEWSGATLGRADEELLRARLARAEGDFDVAWAAGERALVLARDPEQPLVLIAIHRFLGELATEKSLYPVAVEHLSASLNLAETCAMPFERALTLTALGELRVATGETREAGSLLGDARRICRGLDARPALERIEHVSGKIQDVSPGERLGLTRREIDVLRLIVLGKTDREIGADLFISHHTVMRHVSNILGKLEADSRTAAAAYALRHDLV